MKKIRNNKRRAERGTGHLAEKYKRLEKRVVALEHARRRDESWPEIIPMDDEAREIFKRGMADIKAGRLTPAFANSREFQEYRKKKHA